MTSSPTPVRRLICRQDLPVTSLFLLTPRPPPRLLPHAHPPPPPLSPPSTQCCTATTCRSEAVRCGRVTMPDLTTAPMVTISTLRTTTTWYVPLFLVAFLQGVGAGNVF